ncbi:MAG: alpha-mannosidase [Clostridia bacterium]|nr:alpha-mannosidase [Clostridia bacterium]
MEKYLEMKKKAYTHYWAQRILTQMGYLLKVMEAEERPVPSILEETENWLYEKYMCEGTISQMSAKEAEERLAGLKEDAAKYSMICAGHAHIDMNWMWGYQETVNLTIDTFQTMLNLMDEYPEFTFSQSQASVYEIIEKYCPSMLPKIRERVREGRWEVTASTWVEPDKNMTGTESMARHILYTKNYLSNLLGISQDSLELDFEPDTFGHSANVPEILSQGGIKYHYHCRGYEDHTLYRWRAPSGAEVLVNRESGWYLGPVEYGKVLYIPKYSKESHFDRLLYVYGVGDHGGGPTRRDIEKIMDMKTWPLMPKIRFGTIHEFFHEAEAEKEKFPVVDHELNFVLTGCYTTQARIKLANRTGEDQLYDSEMLSAVGEYANKGYDLTKRLDEAWKKVLFNQFHDILPGSGVRETREYAMGQFQEAMSYCGANANRGMKAVGDRIDTTLWGGTPDMDSCSEGAGVGYGTGITTGQWGNAGTSAFGFTNTHRGSGDTRIYTLFNTTQYDRNELAEITLWDWEYQEEEITVLDDQKKKVPVQILEHGTHYWQHKYIKLLILAEVPAFGYANYCVKRERLSREILKPYTDPRVHRMQDGKITLENDKVSGTFDTETMKLVSLADKMTGEELLSEPSGYFRLIREDDVNDMTAWIVGGYMQIIDLNESVPVRIVEKQLTGLQKWLTYEMKFERSSLRTKVMLDEGSSVFRYEVSVDWQETGSRSESIPQLQFYVPVGYQTADYVYDIPAGSQVRPELGHDVPGIYYGAAVPMGGGSMICLTSNCKYGYRGGKQSLTLDLLRGAYDPDPYPDLGIHMMNIGLGVEKNKDNLIKTGFLFSHPLYPYSNTIHTGDMPLKKSFMEISGTAKVSAWKCAEDGSDAWIIRLYQWGDAPEKIAIKTERKIEKAELTDIMENTEVMQGEETGISLVEDTKTVLSLPPHSIRTIKLTF